MFVVVFISSVIQITLVLSICIFLLVKIITDTVWLHVALQLAEIFIHDANGTYHVIIQPVTMDWSTCESQIATLTLRLWDEGSQQDAENKAKTYNEHL